MDLHVFQNALIDFCNQMETSQTHFFADMVHISQMNEMWQEKYTGIFEN